MTTLVLLQSATSNWFQFVLLGGMVFVFYFFMIRPQQKKQKEQEAFRKSLKPGEKVVTIGGLHAVVGSVEDDSTVILIVDKSVKMKFDISAIAGISNKI
ncbi:MAG: preprotein translocase subunit YajC [Cytophagaceae bacterium]|jgi:preprotein translocase subunit YajC|nr:preprotein translocase subunit YajC [Cytophagaceae bacterium]